MLIDIASSVKLTWLHYPFDNRNAIWEPLTTTEGFVMVPVARETLTMLSAGQLGTVHTLSDLFGSLANKLKFSIS